MKPNEYLRLHASLAAFATAAALGWSTAAFAAVPINIENPGFENPAVADTQIDGPPASWTVIGGVDAGVWNPSATDYTGEAPEGSNVGYVFGGAAGQGLAQVLGATFAADSDYTLTVRVGYSNAFNFEGYTVQLLAGGTVLTNGQDDNSNPPAQGTFTTSTVSYVYNAADAALVGQPLEIRLLTKALVGGGETDFDDVQLTVALGTPVANAGGPYDVAIGGSVSLDGSASSPSDGQTITTYEWDLDNDGDFDELITGATPTAISYADLQTTYGMSVGANTIKLRVTDDSSPTPKTSIAEGTVNIAAPLGGQLGILDLNANGGINPNTGEAWKVGDRYRLAFYTDGTTRTESNDPQFYYDFVDSEAAKVTALQGSYWAPMITLNLDSNFPDASAPLRTVKEFSGTTDLTGGSGVGGAGDPVYAMDGTTCIARNNADIWNSWSNPFDNNNTLRLAAGTTNKDSSGNDVVASQSVYYSPFLNQFGLGDSANVHGANCVTGCDSAGNTTRPMGKSADTNPNDTSYGSSNANNPGRVWNRFGTTTTTANRMYAISYPLTVVDLADSVSPSLSSIVDDKGGSDVLLNAGPVVYTVSFDEGIAPKTLDAGDFENAGTATATIDLVRPTFTSNGSFEVKVTPTGAGTLVLQLAAGAVVTDLNGNPLDTATAIPDDTTLNVIDDSAPPVLVSIDDNVSGAPIVATKFSTPTYTVTFDKGVKSGTVGTDDFENGGTAGVTIDSVSATGNPAVYEVVVTTSSAGSLILQIAAGAVIEDLSGNFLETTSALPDDTAITVNPAPELAGQLGLLDIVNANGGINPATGLAWAQGDTYRIIFITSTQRPADSTDIADYNSFVQGVANAAGYGAVNWTAIGSTLTVDAIDNTNTTGTGVGIFNIKNVKIADSYEDFWDGSLDAGINYDETGNLFPDFTNVATGTDPTGVATAVINAAGGATTPQVLGGDDATTPAIQYGRSHFSDGRWTQSFNGAATSGYNFYALSEELTVLGTGTPPPGYAGWAGGFPGLSNTSADLDFDNGGLATGIEWVVGGNPTDGNDDPGLAPTIDNTTDPDFLIFTFRRTDAANADANTAIAVEHGTGLSGWTDAVHDGTNVIIETTDDGFDTAVDRVVVKLRRSALSSDGKIFARLKVVVTIP
ncbi:hypothetical protein HZ994_15485 [Akkermansiaceae bacterium]|nr:hypothetical protein HZ994_15485 [Akkermansiaceae bacterium]